MVSGKTWPGREPSTYCIRHPNHYSIYLKRVFFVVLRAVVQQNAEGHDRAVKLAVLGGGGGVDQDGRAVRQVVATLSLGFLSFFTLLLFFLLQGVC